MGAGIGDDARRLAADSRRSLAGRTRFWGAASAIVKPVWLLNQTCKRVLQEVDVALE